MESITNNLDRFRTERETPQISARNFRESLINEFIERILTDRKGTKYEPKDEREMKRFKKGVVMKLNGNPFLKESWQIESFLKKCREAKVFSACFYGSLKVKDK